MLEVNAKTKCSMSYKIKNTLRYTVTSCTFITPFHGHQWIQKLINLLLEWSFVEDFNIIEKNIDGAFVSQYLQVHHRRRY